MNLDERLRVAASELNETAGESVDHNHMFEELTIARKRQARIRSVASVAVAMIVVAALSIAVARWGTSNVTSPVDSPSPTSEEPTPTPTSDSMRVLQCGYPLRQPCPTRGGDFFVDLITAPGPSPFYDTGLHPSSRLSFVLPQSGWVVAETHSYSLELAIEEPDSSAATDTGIAVLARPAWGRDYYNYSRQWNVEARRLIQRVASLPMLTHPSGNEPIAHQFAGLDAWRTDIALPVGSPTTAWCRNAFFDQRTAGDDRRCIPVFGMNYTGTQYGLAPGHEATVIAVQTPTRWPLVVWVAGDPELLGAHSQEVSAILNSMTLTRTDS